MATVKMESVLNSAMRTNCYYSTVENPMTLQQLCRISIRHKMDSKQMQHIEDLPLPAHIIRYLQFHFHSYTEARESDDSGVEMEEL